MINNSYLLSKHLNYQLISLYSQAVNLYLSPEDQFVIKEDDQSMLSQSVTCNETIDVLFPPNKTNVVAHTQITEIHIGKAISNYNGYSPLENQFIQNLIQNHAKLVNQILEQNNNERMFENKCQKPL